MRRPRFTIAGLLVIVLMIAVALAALWEANDLWDGGLFAGVTFTLITAILLVVHRREGSRAFWLGYYLFGWAYLLDSLVPTIEFRLPTTRGLAYLGSWKAGRAKVWEDDLILQGVRGFETRGKDWASPGPSNVVLLVDGSGSLSQADARLLNLIVAPPGGTPEDFVRIGHSLAALVWAFLGGLAVPAAPPESPSHSAEGTGP